jgi:hypothetical protein
MDALFVSKSLDEIRFWSRIMKEHALFLSLGFTYEDKELIKEANQFIGVFEQIEQQLSTYTDHTDPQLIKKFIKPLLPFGHLNARY